MNTSLGARLALLCALTLSTFGCWSTEPPAGTVAEINGKVIGFTELEAVRNSMYFSRSSLQDIANDVELQQQYIRALRQLIMQEIAAQELERLGKSVEPADLDRLEGEIRADYPPDAYAVMLEEQGLDEKLVRMLLRRRLDMEQYVAKVLRPEIVVTPEEVQAYYEAHKKYFIIPEQLLYLQITAPVKAEVEAAAKALLEGMSPAELQKKFGVTLREVRTARETLPEDVRVALESQGLRKAGPAVEAEGEFRVLILAGKSAESQVDPATTAARVEAMLMEEKVPPLLQERLEKRLRSSTLFIAEPLLRDAAKLSTPEKKKVVPPAPSAPREGPGAASDEIPGP